MDVKIGAINLNLKFCKKINESRLDDKFVPKICAANTYLGDDERSYIVNIFAYIPHNRQKITAKMQSGFFLNQTAVEDNEDEASNLFFQYNGVRLINSEIEKPENTLKLRDFNIVFNDEETPDWYDLFHIQVEYIIDAEHSFEAEGVHVALKNLDPKLKRGTITTSSQG